VKPDLLALTAELVDLPSVSRHEGELVGRIESDLRASEWLEIERIGDNLIARTQCDRPQRVVMAGHLDTVPPAGNDASRVEGDVLWGVGAADMKGGLAVMLALARTLREPPVDVTWCFYAREEIAHRESGLGEVWASRPELLEADAAVLAEPTDCLVEAGCQGTMRAILRLGGVRAHTARPYTGVNAIHRLGPVLERVSAWPGREVVLDGCTYAEQLQAVAVSGGVAPNVVPDEATVTLNLRFAPDRGAPQAEHTLRMLFDGLVGGGVSDSITVVEALEGAPPSLDHPVLASLVAATGQPPRAKVGWTDVASFWARGVPAANFGPGDPLLAHRPDEHVTRESLERARQVLADLLCASL
jgi:succinyl-diaminopimelate desuccinylase